MDESVNSFIQRRVREAIEQDRRKLLLTEDARQERSCAAAAAAHAWLASLPDSIFNEYKNKGLSSPYLFAILYRIWPKSWPARWLELVDRRASLIRAASLIIAELEEIEIMTALSVKEVAE